VVTNVQQALALEKVSFDSQENTVIIRDRISKMLPARALLEDMLYQRGQAAIEMRLVEVSRKRRRTIRDRVSQPVCRSRPSPRLSETSSPFRPPCPAC